MSNSKRLLLISIVSLILLVSIFSFVSAQSSGGCDTIFCMISGFFSNLLSGKPLTGQTVLTPTEQANCPAGLIAYWNFDENSGSTADDAFNANNGNLINGPAWTADSVAGGALDFDGADDYVSVPHNNIFNFGANDWTISVWAKVNSFNNYNGLIGKSAATSYAPYYIGTGNSIGNPGTWMLLSTTDPAQSWNVAYEYSFGAATPGNWQHIVVTRNSGIIDFYVNDVKTSTLTQTYGAGPLDNLALWSNNEPLIIGKNAWSGGSSVFNGLIDEVAVFSRGFSQSDVDDIYGKGVNHQGVCYAEPASECPSGMTNYYRFNEGTGNVLDDSAGSADGAINDATWISRGTGSALSFDGSNDYVNLGDAPFDWVDYNKPYTISFWGNIKDYTEDWVLSKRVWPLGWDVYFRLGTNAGVIMAQDGNNYYQGQWNYPAVYHPNEWAHYTFVYNGQGVNNNNFDLYVNGVNVGHPTFNGYDLGTVTSSIVNNYPLEIGRNGNGAYGNFDIDELAFFNTALSSEEISGLYNGGNEKDLCEAAEEVACGDGDTQGMISYYKLDESSGNAIDSYGDNDGTVAGATQNAPGQVNTAYSFDDNSCASVDIPNVLTYTDSTISLWMNTNDEVGYFFHVGSGGDYRPLILTYPSGGFVAVNIYAVVSQEVVTGVAPNTWFLLTLTHAGTTNNVYINGELKQTFTQTWTPASSSYLTLGKIKGYGGECFRGSLDEVAIYDRALTADEVAAQYERSSEGNAYCPYGEAGAPPVCGDGTVNQVSEQCDDGNTNSGDGCSATCQNEEVACGDGDTLGMVSYWKLDEGTGSIAGDSKDSNNGTFVRNVQWIPGEHVGNSLYFDGNSYVNVPASANLNTPNKFTVEAWIYPTINANNDAIAAREGTDDFQYALVYGAWTVTGDNSQVMFQVAKSAGWYTATSSQPLSLNQWHHVVGVYDGSNVKIYVDGIETIGDVVSAPLDSTSAPFTIGDYYNLNGQYAFTGKIDEVAVYNDTLTAEEINNHFTRTSGGVNHYCGGAPAVCGNSIVETGEECDDGNTVSGDGCSSTCMIETACPSGMVSYWKGENNYNDEKGNNNGVLTGSVGFDTGIVGDAFSFDGNPANYIDISANPSIQTKSFTMEYWSKASPNPNVMGYVWNRGTGVYTLQMYIPILDSYQEGGQIIYGGYIDAPGVQTTYYNALWKPMGGWHHLVMTYDESTTTGRFYIDGEKSREFTGTYDIPSNTAIRIGNIINFGSGAYAGLLDELAYYNRALTEAEILDHYNGGAGKDYCGEAGPVCTNGQVRSCEKQAGVCAGSNEVCANENWPGCDYSGIPNYQATETSCDGIDNDCDGSIDEDACGTTNYYCDSDDDGYISAGTSGSCNTWQCTPSGCQSTAGNDCNDNNGAVHPGAVEGTQQTCWDGLDNNCNGLIDNADPECTIGQAQELPDCTLDQIFDLNGDSSVNVQDIVHLQRWIAWQLTGQQGPAPELIANAKACELFSVQRNPAVVMQEQSLC